MQPNEQPASSARTTAVLLVTIAAFALPIALLVVGFTLSALDFLSFDSSGSTDHSTLFCAAAATGIVVPFVGLLMTLGRELLVYRVLLGAALGLSLLAFVIVTINAA